MIETVTRSLCCAFDWHDLIPTLSTDLPMRKLLPVAIAIAAAVATQPATAQQQPRDTTLSITITRVGRSPADRASLYFGVEAVAETALAAIERLQVKIKAVLDSAKRASPTTHADAPIVLSVGPNAPNGYPQTNSPVNVARAAIRVVVSKLADIPQLQLAASTAGALMSTSPQYESAAVDSVWRVKVAEALASVRAAADLSADAQGYTLGRMLTMTVTGGPQQGFQQPTQFNFEARGNYTPLVAPETMVNATVSVTYLLVRR